MNYTELTRMIEKNTLNPILFSNLVILIQEKYDDVKKGTIELVLMEWIKSEFLITNLNIPSFCDDKLLYVSEILSNISKDSVILKQIRYEINNQCGSKFNVKENAISEFNSIVYMMKNLYKLKNDNYVSIDKADILSENNISQKYTKQA